jgi:quinol monooxygenase YgiN
MLFTKEEHVMILSTIRMTVSATRREELLQTIRQNFEPLAFEPGCISRRFYQDTADKNVFMLVQAWKSKEDLDNYFYTPSFEILLAAMELLAESPEVRFITSSSAVGFEAISAARAKNKIESRLRNRPHSRKRRFIPCGTVLDGRIGYGMRSGN